MNNFKIFYLACTKARSFVTKLKIKKKNQIINFVVHTVSISFYFSSKFQSIMADFLGNIMAGMAGPPKASDKEIAERKKARELAKKIEIRNKQESKDFRLEIDKRIDTFLKLPIGDENRKMIFEAMPKGMYLLIV